MKKSTTITKKKQVLTDEQKLELARFVEKINTMIPSDYQQAIFEKAQTQQGRYVINAGPGSGKTTTAIKASTYFRGGRSLYLAFNRKIMLDTHQKLTALGAKMTASTLHSFGLSCLQALTRGRCQVNDDKYDQIIDDYLRDHWTPFLMSQNLEDVPPEQHPSQTDAREWSAKLIHYAQVTLTTPTLDGLYALIEQFDLYDINPTALIWPFVCTLVTYALEEGRHQFQTFSTVSFDDMIYYPNALKDVPIRTYDHIILDEAQDASRAGLGLLMRACHEQSQVFAIGDVKQCQPAGSMVQLQDGSECPIEQLKIGDYVTTFDRRSAAFVRAGLVTDIASRHYTGPLCTITAGDKRSRCTDSHKWLVRWANTDKPVWITYLMRKGDYYRVGQCTLFDGNDLQLSRRISQEHADAAWILSTHESSHEALSYETIVAAKYRLPQLAFIAHKAHKTWTAEMIEQVYADIPSQQENAIQCLQDHGRSIHYPFCKRENGKRQTERGRTSTLEAQACNLIPKYMAIPIFESKQWEAIEVTFQFFSGPVYSLNVQDDHNYVADGLVTLNSIYAFAGADGESIPNIIQALNAEVLALRVCYRCGKNIIDLANQLDGQIIPAPGAHEGTVAVLSAEDYRTMLGPRDVVLARTTKHLVKDCLAVLQTGRRAMVLGKDLGRNIAAIVSRLEEMRVGRGQPALARNLSNFAELLEEYTRIRQEEIAERRNLKNKDLALDELNDRIETVKAFYIAYISKCLDHSTIVEHDPKCQFNRTAEDFKYYIKALFTDDTDKNIILFMTAHRSKGGEWERVFIIGTDEFPHPKAKSDKQFVQETNLMYVAITRAINELYFVNEPFSCLTIPGYESEDRQRERADEEDEPVAPMLVEEAMPLGSVDEVTEGPTHIEEIAPTAAPLPVDTAVEPAREAIVRAPGRPKKGAKGRTRMNISVDVDVAGFLRTQEDISNFLEQFVKALPEFAEYVALHVNDEAKGQDEEESEETEAEPSAQLAIKVVTISCPDCNQQLIGPKGLFLIDAPAWEELPETMICSSCGASVKRPARSPFGKKRGRKTKAAL